MLAMPSLVQKAWYAMTDFETNFYVDHPAPTREECEDHDMSGETVPGWSYREDSKSWCPNPRPKP